MKILNNNALDLQGADHEVITVGIVTKGTRNLVSSVLDGGSPSSLPTDVTTSSFSFTLDKSKHNPTILTMLFTFSERDGGNYAITVTGSGGGDTSHFTVAQLFHIPGDSITYTLDIT